MANLIRRSEDQSAQTPAAWEPLQLMREFLGWDPFAEMMPSLSLRQEAVFSPRFEVKETKDGYVFHADLPGIADKDLDITLTGNRLTVSGKREAVQHQEGDRFYAYERTYGSFTRSFTLPEGANVDGADADLKNGVLTVSIPKRSEHQPRKITLKAIGEKVKGALGGKDKGQA
jgi:HSP20 family protein